MASTRDMRLRIRSVKNLAQVTKALETVSASKVRRAVAANKATQPYAEKAWKVLVHLARQPGHQTLHPLLTDRPQVRKVLVLMVSADRGLAGPYNVNIFRHTMDAFHDSSVPVSYVAVGRKGRDLLIRRREDVIAEFSDLPSPPSFTAVAPIGQLLVEDYQKGLYDEVYVTFTQFHNLLKQTPVTQRLLPMNVVFKHDESEHQTGTTHRTSSVFTYEPDSSELLDEIVPRFIGLQVYQAILSSQASEHAARMVAMRNATESAKDLIGSLQLDYNKLRQLIITNDMLDIAGGANALTQA